MGYSIWNYYRAMEALAQVEKIPFVDLVPVFRIAAKKENLFLENIHPNAAGHRLIANNLEPLLSK